MTADQHIDDETSDGVFGFIADEADRGERLDKVVSRHVDALSRSRLKSLILDGALSIDDATTLDASLKLRGGERVVLRVPEAAEPEPRGEAIPLVIVHEDADLIVIDKPAGLVVHPAAGHADGTLVNALIAHCGASLSGIGGVKRPGIVHRLDKDTSGLMVVAKNDHAHRSLAAQFADHGRTGPLIRAYKAFVWGVPERARGTVAARLDRSHANREKIAIVGEGRGREAITHYAVERSYAGAPMPNGGNAAVASLVECRLETGRTHQIRVHMASIGHPLLGDAVYGSGFKTKAALLKPAARSALAALGSRQALHAAILGFEHPTSGEAMLFESALPAELAQLETALAP